MQTEKSSFQVLGRRPGEWLSSLPMFCLLLLTLVIGTGEMFHGQMLRLGEQFFGDPKAEVQYFMLRTDPVKPDCNPHLDIDAEVARLQAQTSAPGDDISALFADTAPSDPAALRRSVEQGQLQCAERFAAYEKANAHITPGLKAFRAVETSFFDLFHFGTENRSLVLLLIVFFAAVTTTLQRHHISLRPAHTRAEGLVQAGAMLAANVLVVASVWSHYQISLNSGVAIEKPWLFHIWMALFGLLALINVGQMATSSRGLKPGGNPLAGLLTIPLYTYMALSAGIYFLTQGHTAGLSIYINQMMELSGIFLNLALYIWIGMLLKQMRVVDLFLSVLRPWKLSPEALTYVILLAAAVPTAYTGASGIFVIAAGSIIYHEVRRSGGNAQFALAASAMSGSLGVVLRPCLLVVLIAALNKQVTTAQLYHWGFYVFLLTSTLFFIVSQFYRTQKVQMAAPAVAIPEMLRRTLPLIPYIIAMIMVVLAYQFLLNTKLDEFTAPVIIPVVMLLLLFFDQWKRGRELRAGVKAEHGHYEAPVGIEKALRFSTNETIGHIGALITLMALSLAMGGMVERSGIMEHAPSHFSSVWMAMTFLMVAKVLLGMIMDPFGAVILVSGTLAPIAYNAGIDPVHFWMMVLVAFELGYLLPPVAINQLLLRQVVGDEEIDRATEEFRHHGFWRRYQRWLMPIIVMTIGLVIVAYLPLAVVGK
jgi:TRAP-type C4-dicarboxylate transport system permease large subunit